MDLTEEDAPAVSVLMPSYNHEKYIEKAIASVLSQEGCDFELVIVDDFSTDNSRRIIQDFAEREKRIKANYHDSNKGIAETTTDCISNATGKYMITLSSDDMLKPGALSDMLVAIEREPRGDVLLFDAECIDAKGERLGYTFWDLHRKPPDDTTRMFDELLKDNFVIAGMISLQILREKNLKPLKDVPFMNDWVFWLDVAASCDFKILDKPVYLYRIHGTNTSFVDRWLEDSVKAYTKMLERHSDIMSKKQKSVIQYYLGLSLIKVHSYSSGRRQLFNAFVNDPLSLKTLKAFLVFSMSYFKFRGELAVNILGRLRFSRIDKVNMSRIRERYRKSAGKRD